MFFCFFTLGPRGLDFDIKLREKSINQSNIDVSYVVAEGEKTERSHRIQHECGE